MWELFDEKFIKREEKQQYYFPEILCKEFLEHRYQKEITSEDVEQLKQYYRGKISFVDLQKNKNLNHNNFFIMILLLI